MNYFPDFHTRPFGFFSEGALLDAHQAAIAAYNYVRSQCEASGGGDGYTAMTNHRDMLREICEAFAAERNLRALQSVR